MPGIDLLLATTARLRAPDGCPWDREQTHRTICDCLVEEVAELVQAIDRDDVENLREELGDLLFHVAMHAQMASEAGQFNFDDVAREVNEKMVRRHPHVFGDGAKLGSSDAVVTQWEQIKLKEKGAKKPTVFKDLPPSLNALLTAREREIAVLLAKSHTSKEVAAKLNISTKTAENHRTNLMRKLGVHDVAGVIRYVVRQGLYDPSGEG